MSLLYILLSVLTLSQMFLTVFKPIGIHTFNQNNTVFHDVVVAAISALSSRQ